MTTPLSVIFEGDVTLLNSSDTTQFGFGDLAVNRKGIFNGTTAATNATTANLVNLGGFGNVGDTYLNQILNVSGGSFLNALNVNTNLGATNITGSGAVNVSVGNTVYLSANSGNLTLSSNLSSILQGSAAAINAIQITALNAAGGIQLLSGTATGIVNVGAGSGGFIVGASGGSVNTTSYGASSNFIVNSNAVSQALNISLTGAFDNGVNITSTGINATVPAIKIETLNTSGNIILRNAGGLGGGAITLTSGSGGISALTNTGGSINLTSQAASTTISVNSAAANQNLILQTLGAFNSGVVIQSQSTNTAIQLLAQSATGSIVIGNTVGSSGKIEVDAGTGGYQLSSTGGNINATSIGASSTYKVISTAGGQNLNIVQTGSSASQILVQSAGTGTNALQFQTVTSGGGISITAQGKIDIQTTDNVNGINIGTVQSGVVNIGKSGSNTTVFGNLDVKGTTTIIESTIATYVDNVIMVNNGPNAISDGGLAIKRYQPANDTSLGQVVNPVGGNPLGYETGTAQAGTTTTITLASGANATDTFYNGAWLIINSGTGAGQVREIKSYVGSTKIATIYGTADQTGVLGNPTPVAGLDFTTAPGATSVYSIYPTTYAINIWHEATNEFAYVYGSVDPATGQVNYNYTGGTTGNYANLHINNLSANSITANSINNTTTDLVFTVLLDDNATTPVNMAGLTNNYGIYLVLVRPTTANSTRPFAIFAIGRANAAVSGSSNRIFSVKSSNAQLDIQWSASSLPQLVYRPNPGVVGTTSYTLRCITI